MAYKDDIKVDNALPSSLRILLYIFGVILFLGAALIALYLVSSLMRNTSEHIDVPRFINEDIRFVIEYVYYYRYSFFVSIMILNLIGVVGIILFFNKMNIGRILVRVVTGIYLAYIIIVIIQLGLFYIQGNSLITLNEEFSIASLLLRAISLIIMSALFVTPLGYIFYKSGEGSIRQIMK